MGGCWVTALLYYVLTWFGEAFGSFNHQVLRGAWHLALSVDSQGSILPSALFTFPALFLPRLKHLTSSIFGHFVHPLPCCL